MGPDPVVSEAHKQLAGNKTASGVGPSVVKPGHPRQKARTERFPGVLDCPNKITSQTCVDCSKACLWPEWVIWQSRRMGKPCRRGPGCQGLVQELEDGTILML